MDNKLGNRLKDLRIENRKTQEQVAKDLGTTKATIGRYEIGTREPKTDILNSLADYFNVSTDYLLGRTNQRNSQINLNEKDEKDIAKNMNILLEQLQNQQAALMFDGEALDDETRELLASSLENSLRMGKIIAKEKYTPKKYRDKDK